MVSNAPVCRTPGVFTRLKVDRSSNQPDHQEDFQVSIGKDDHSAEHCSQRPSGRIIKRHSFSTTEPGTQQILTSVEI